MTELEKKIYSRYGAPPKTPKKEETISDIIARGRLNAVKSEQNTEIEWDEQNISEYFYKVVNQLCNFRNRSFRLTDDFKEGCEAVINWINGGYLENRWLLLYGSVGNGKTTAAKAAMSVFQKMGQNGLIKNAFDISLLYNDIEKKQRAADEYMLLSNTVLLCIDDLGTESNPAALSEILYHRYNNMLATVFTTNLDYSELEAKYGARIFDRFEELVETVHFAGESFRRKIVQQKIEFNGF